MGRDYQVHEGEQPMGEEAAQARRVRIEVLNRLDEEMRMVLREHRWIPSTCQQSCPLLVLRDSLAEWGRCIQAGEGYRIELRTDLVFEHPWYAVKEVLLHELAHFVVMYLYPRLSEGPHGETFKRVCGRLGGNVKASGTYRPLDMTMLLDDDSSESQASPVELKIAKLLALSESPNEHEAHLALCKARELMARHGVSGAADDSDPYVSVEVVMPGSRMQREEFTLMHILDTYYGVRCLGDHGFALEDGRLCPRRFVSISGRRSKVKVALYVRDYVWRLVDDWWRRHGGGVRIRRDYALGFLAGMRESLVRQECGDGAHWGLVRREEAGLEAYFHARYPCIRRRISNRVQVDASVTQAGRRAGSQVRIRPGIETGAGETGTRLLGE